MFQTKLWNTSFILEASKLLERVIQDSRLEVKLIS